MSVERRPRAVLIAAVCLALVGGATAAIRDPRTPQQPTETRGAAVMPTTTYAHHASTPSQPETNGAVVEVDIGDGTRSVGPGKKDPPRRGTGPGSSSNSEPTQTASTSSPTSSSGCPNPKTCEKYRFADGPTTKGWRLHRGLVSIPFYVNPAPPANSALTPEDIEGAILRAVSVWQSAHPSIRYEYKGRTSREPVKFDGFNDFAYGAWAVTTTDAEGYIIEADIYRTVSAHVRPDDAVSAPCEQRDGACGPIETGQDVIEQLTTHEVGHTLGLGDLQDDDARLLTMHGSGGMLGDRYQQTLGRGDVLGLRALYPTSASFPPIYSP